MTPRKKPEPPPIDPLTPKTWADHAACLNHPDVGPDAWYMDGTSKIDRLYTRAARRVCDECPVRIECLTWAYTNAEQYGMWGGFTGAERRNAVRRGWIAHRETDQLDTAS